jgi:hypothetical protein
VILYAILSHKEPDQVLRLARRITASDPHGVVAIHHDANAPALPDPGDPRIVLVRDRVPVAWGDFSIVAALLRCMQSTVDVPYRWFVVLSGQDYPCRPLAGLEAELDAGGVDAYLECAPFSQVFPEDNTTRYFFRYRRLPPATSALARRAWRLNRLQPFVRIVGTRAGSFAGIRSPAPFGPHFAGYRGSFWCALARPCVDAVRAFVEERPGAVRAFAHKLIPDEAFVHSVLANAGRFRFADHALHYIVWPGNDGGSPNVLRGSDEDAIVRSGRPFARKFDPAVDAAILDRLDERIART